MRADPFAHRHHSRICAEREQAHTYNKKKCAYHECDKSICRHSEKELKHDYDERNRQHRRKGFFKFFEQLLVHSLKSFLLIKRNMFFIRY